jgi:hypothetical protein
MALIGEIITKIKVDASQQKRELSKAKKALLGFGRVAKKALSGLAVGAGVATAAFVGVAAVVNKTAESIDLLAKTSAKLGVTVAALQKLEFQAALTGVSSEKLSQTLQRMTRGVSEAAAGFGTAKKALAELNLDAEVLNKLSPDKAFNLISVAFRGISNQSDKVRLAMQIFGREGVALVNTMNSDLEATGKQFDKLGISISQSQAKAVEAFNDSKTVLGQILGGFAQQLTVKLAPAFKFLIDKVSEFVISMGGMGKVAEKVANVVLGAMSNILGAITSVANGIDNVILGYEKLALIINKTQAASTALWSPVLTDNFVKGQFDQVVAGEKAIEAIQKRIAERNKTTSAIQAGVLGAQGAISQAAAAPSQGKIELLVKSDPNAAIEILKKDKVVDNIVQTIIREETAKIGR